MLIEHSETTTHGDRRPDRRRGRASHAGRQARTKLELVATFLLPNSVALPGMDRTGEDT
jgi:hypothetical protein